MIYKNIGTLFRQFTPANKFSDRAAGFEVWINLNERFRPEAAVCIEVVKTIDDVWCPHLGERSRKMLVVFNDNCVQVKNIHVASSVRDPAYEHIATRNVPNHRLL
jgi:hypothetical protein